MVQICGIKYIHIVLLPSPPVHLQNFLIFLNWNSVPIKH